MLRPPASRRSLRRAWRQIMNYKQKLGYTVLGAVIMAVGIAIGQFSTPNIEAQSNGVFDDIRCYGLTVMNKHGDPAIVLGSSSRDENAIILYNQARIPVISLLC